MQKVPKLNFSLYTGNQIIEKMKVALLMMISQALLKIKLPENNGKIYRIGVVAAQLTNAQKRKLQNFLQNPEIDLNNLTYINNNYWEFIKKKKIEPFPLPVTASKEELADLLTKLDGVFLPGGSPHVTHHEKKRTPFSTVHIVPNKKSMYFETSQFILSKAIELNKERPFLIYGICMGFASILLKHTNFDMPFNLIYKTYTVDNIYFNPSDSDFYSLAKQKQTPILNQGLVHFNNIHGVTTKSFSKFSELSNFEVRAVYKTELSSETYVGAIEHKDKPIFAVQFHPEKNLYESGSVLKKFAKRKSNKIGDKILTQKELEQDEMLRDYSKELSKLFESHIAELLKKHFSDVKPSQSELILKSHQFVRFEKGILKNNILIGQSAHIKIIMDAIEEKFGTKTSQ